MSNHIRTRQSLFPNAPQVVLTRLRYTSGHFNRSKEIVTASGSQVLGPLLQPSWLLLEFMGELQRLVVVATEGSELLPSTCHPAAAFFKAAKNCKVMLSEGQCVFGVCIMHIERCDVGFLCVQKRTTMLLPNT